MLHLLEYIESDGYTYTSYKFVGIYDSKDKVDTAMLEHHYKMHKNKAFFEHNYEVTEVSLNETYV